ncbi:MAG: DNA repair protein RecO [Saprospiraceae bacterium]|nr:DNA repair protein RecO [Saprospiraceae bacterium]
MSKIFSSEGIVFRTIKYSESSIICDIFTREKGLRSFIASGVRSSKSGNKAALYRPANIVDVVAYDQDQDKLSRIKEITFNYLYRNINLDIRISSIAIFILEVSRNSIKEKEANEELYDFLNEWLKYLDNAVNYHSCLHLKFMLDFSFHLGFSPLDGKNKSKPYFDMLEGVFCDYINDSPNILNEDESNIISTLLHIKKESLHNVNWSKSVRNSVTDHLIRFYKLHLSGFRDLNSMEVLRSVL